MSRILGPLCALLAIGCGVLAFLLLQQRRTLEGLQATIAAQKQTIVADRAAEAKRREKAAEALKVRTARREAAAKAGVVTVSAAARAARDAQAKANGTVDLGPYLDKDPEWAELRRLRDLRNLARTYPDLEKLNLPPDKLAKLKELLVDRMEAPQDARAVAAQQGIDPNSREMMDAISLASSQVTNDIGALVGADALKQINQMQSLSSYRNQLQYQVGQDLAASGAPLTSAQMDALAAAEAAVAQGPHPRGWNYTQAINQALTSAAPGVLTPEQLSVFQDSLSFNAKMQAVQQRAMNAARKELGEVHSFGWSN